MRVFGMKSNRNLLTSCYILCLYRRYESEYITWQLVYCIMNVVRYIRSINARIQSNRTTIPFSSIPSCALSRWRFFNWHWFEIHTNWNRLRFNLRIAANIISFIWCTISVAYISSKVDAYVVIIIGRFKIRRLIGSVRKKCIGNMLLWMFLRLLAWEFSIVVNIIRCFVILIELNCQFVYGLYWEMVTSIPLPITHFVWMNKVLKSTQ